ncbi:hypothetical protein [Streptomyces sp. NBC_01408]|uniref:hypothetical protein n=1 Tax=Streptomyces sp. NBC_01408 TaxID=2903855 RepID=UPI0022591782|nr:hypothetical protein [Streptomyces sp. NBC_01408]MCX4691971.1 hypothetical protein [Streptomyces sp. NBC_01408]
MDPHTEATLAPPLAAVPLPGLPPQPSSAEPSQPSGGTHNTSTTERGAFCLAVCSCGWKGPARRSRDLARKDAGRHAARD